MYPPGLTKNMMIWQAWDIDNQKAGPSFVQILRSCPFCTNIIQGKMCQPVNCNQLQTAVYCTKHLLVLVRAAKEQNIRNIRKHSRRSCCLKSEVLSLKSSPRVCCTLVVGSDTPPEAMYITSVVVPRVWCWGMFIWVAYWNNHSLPTNRQDNINIYQPSKTTNWNMTIKHCCQRKHLQHSSQEPHGGPSCHRQLYPFHLDLQLLVPKDRVN